MKNQIKKKEAASAIKKLEDSLKNQVHSNSKELDIYIKLNFLYKYLIGLQSL